ncbi:phosphoglucomutase/phosphomannomutase family protein [Candidatus Cyanaurora vandensis]|uniref:phosphoglucomutase/phosphomannomutase family protein n=1 Tax=Candidatus Cyanaurora vandensis TaxID=2714958 RepID=UPI00257BFDBE|nr:phosphoglucomutase/phosphomannomutase family protein [Candidatus Cyanaurora vandensis]
MAIQFGTDGWRGIIADDFTFAALRQAARASAEVLAQYPGSGVLVGYDHRFLSPEFAQAVAETLVRAGFTVFLADCAAPTPAISWAVKQMGAIGGLMITASHNPASYSGLKVKGYFGGSVPETITRQIEMRLTETFTDKRGGTLHTFNPWAAYLTQLRTKVDLTAIAAAPIKVFLDAMHGSGSGGLERLGLPVTTLRANRDPLFGGVSPEPVAKNLAPAFHVLKGIEERAVVLVLDGDADRIGAINGDGTYLNCQYLIPLLIDHLTRRRGLTGKVVKTLSGSDLIRRVAQQRGCPVAETAVGFKYIAAIMEREPVLLGGEESGGIGFLDHMPERDALLSALYLLEILAHTPKTLLELYEDLCLELDFTPVYDRIDVPLPDRAFKTALIARLQAQPPRRVADQAVTEHSTVDGHKFQLGDAGWLMIRFSGTEPLLRLYAEGRTTAWVRHTLHWAKDWALA